MQQTLRQIQRTSPAGGTRLYDSVRDVILHFWRDGKRDRPWLLTIITDGQDNESSTYRNNPAGIGAFVAQHFNHEPSNFIFTVGVGSGQQIDKTALATFGNNGGFLAMTIDAFPLLEAVFLQIAVHVSTQLHGTRLQVGNLTWTDVQRVRQVAHVPLDYAFVIDRSGSMNEEG